jgi:diguanylate cyclase (GGDEF)-like protein/PAS domain S-box-containing protein
MGNLHRSPDTAGEIGAGDDQMSTERDFSTDASIVPTVTTPRPVGPVRPARPVDRSISQPVATDAHPEISALELLNLSADVMVVVNDQACLEYVSAGVRQLLAREPEEWLGASIVDHIHPDDLERSMTRLTLVLDGAPSLPHDVRIRNAAGSWIDVELTARRVVTASGLRKLVVSMRDTSDRQILLARVRWQANHDSLTGLLSFHGLQEKIEQAIEFDSGMLIMRIDVDGFARINEFYGHRFGDAAMRLFGSRFVEMAATNACVARLGGDDFVVVQPYPVARFDKSAEELAVREATLLVERLAGPYELDGVSIELNFRVGLSTVAHATELLGGIAESEAALAYAKKRDLDTCAFDAGMREATVRRRKLEVALRSELQDAQNITLEYQPIIEAASRTVSCYEGLARWTQDDAVSVSPAEFVPIAEATGKMSTLTRHVLNTGIAQLAAWKAANIATKATISVNVPVGQIQRPEFIPQLQSLLAHHAVDPNKLVIELTESNMIERLDLVRYTLDQLKELGCKVAIDDFGTGYSSFGWLRDLPVEIIKIDRSFVRPLATDIASVHIVRAIVDLCKRLGFTVIAEGVETRTQADMLTALGVDRLQGFAFGPAQPATLAGKLYGTQLSTP